MRITTRDAIRLALIALEGRPLNSSDTAAVKARLNQILKQRGTKAIDSASDDTLPDLIDIIIDG